MIDLKKAKMISALESLSFEMRTVARRALKSLRAAGRHACTGASSCIRCGRRLTDPKSIENGIGPVCAKQGFWQMEFFGREGTVNRTVPYNGGHIHLLRNEFETVVNVPHKHVYHSPTGFDWGYGGSGPSDLALNILALFTDYKHALKYHHDFKWKYIASLPKKGGCIPRGVILTFLKKRGAPLLD